MRNVTISLDDDTARWARIEAACHDMSLSRFVGEVLRERMASSDAYERAMRSYLSRGATFIGAGDGPLPSRDEIHQR